MRSLGPDEQALWARVAATIRPLSRDLRDKPAVEAPNQVAAPEPAVRQPVIGRTRPSVQPKPKPGTTLDGSWDRKLKAGTVSPDRIIDLHGHDLDRAWTAIDRGIEQAIASGDRLILLITGHARTGEPPIVRGRIRAAIHDWLAASRHAGSIAAVRGAHRRHGGGGSLYLILRRR